MSQDTIDSSTEVTADTEPGPATSRESDLESQSTASTSKVSERDASASEEDEPESNYATDSDENQSTHTRMSFYKFAGSSNSHMTRWMLDRKSVMRSLGSDIQFRNEYLAMTDFYWPAIWNDREDFGGMCQAMERHVDGLLEEIAYLKVMQPNQIKCAPVESLPFDLRTIVHLGFLDNIFHTAGMRDSYGDDMPWKHEHVHLLRYFFQQSLPEEGVNNADTEQLTARKAPYVNLNLQRALRLPKSNMRGNKNRKEVAQKMQSVYSKDLEACQNISNNSSSDAASTQRMKNMASRFSKACKNWEVQPENESESQEASYLKTLPSTGIADAVGFLRVNLNGVSVEDIGLFSLEVDEGTQRKKGQHNDESEDTEEDSGVKVSSLGGHFYLGINPRREEEEREAYEASLVAGSKYAQAKEDVQLALPILVAAIAGEDDDGGHEAMKRLEMLLVSSLKFLESIGITDFTVYGLTIVGPAAYLVAGMIKDDELVHIFDGGMKFFNIATPMDVWHYVTVLSRIAETSKVLQKRFKAVKAELIASLLNDPTGDEIEAWTMDHQLETLDKGKGKMPTH